ncbi:hypothetical protein T492DRAFT_895033 [Pavlovales sp. CCMP2436]|nr:hypothetical protein T492DRAFT_895033 [Pavlovales sp. CCMP2436]
MLPLAALLALTSGSVAAWELVGAGGRVGAALAAGEGAGECAAARMGRHDCAERLGRASAPGSPVVVATAADAWGSICSLARERGRERDLVLVGNGPLEWSAKAGTAILLYARATSVQTLESQPPCPSSRAYGVHGPWFAARLARLGISCTVDADRARFERHAAAKLAWACTMWLACDELDCSCELISDDPLVLELAREVHPWLTDPDGAAAPSERFLLTQLRDYSLSLPGVRPSVRLARLEYGARRGSTLVAQ